MPVLFVRVTFPYQSGPRDRHGIQNACGVPNDAFHLVLLACDGDDLEAGMGREAGRGQVAPNSFLRTGEGEAGDAYGDDDGDGADDGARNGVHARRDDGVLFHDAGGL
ncbi:hypothetical protein RhiTH_005633 [Rhizoctonia solani]